MEMQAARPQIAAPSARLAGPLLVALGLTAAVLAGVLAVEAPAIAVLIPLLGLLVLALTVAPCYWVLAAVVAAVCSRAAVAVDLLPGFGAYIDLPLAWGAFVFALLTSRSWSSNAQWVVLGVAGLGLAAAGSGLLAGVSVVQSLFSYALLGAPFALLGAILLAPPSAPERKHLVTVGLALAFIQIPIAIVQSLHATHPDQVQGTFVGSQAGAHLVGAVAVVAAVWLIGRARTSLQALAAVPLLLVPVLSEANAALFVMPVALLAMPAYTKVARRLRVVVVVGILAVLGSLALREAYTVRVLERTLSGDSEKLQAVREVESQVTESPSAFVFGTGPARSVSFSALLSLEPLKDPESPVRLLHLEPSETLRGLGGLYHGFSSLVHPASSALGVWGDLGAAGGLIYFALAGCLFVSARRRQTPDGAAAAGALAMFVVLGVLFIWWEQTGFSLYVALIAGLALADGRRSSRRSSSAPT